MENNVNFIVIVGYLEELLRAGPDAIALIKDVVRAFNDFRAGKLDSAEFNVIIDDCKKLALDLFSPAKPAA